jgi:RNA polymerase sigma factor (TIGR02999 family)
MPEAPSTDSVKSLMQKFREGDCETVERLVELCYPELRSMAASRIKRERMPHTWQPTVLINELYLELTKVKSLGRGDGGEQQERSAFLGLCGHIMKRLLQHHARPLYRRRERVSLSEGLCADSANPETFQEVEDALTQLAAINPKLRAVVEMRVFEGLTGDEIAERLGCSRRSVTFYWDVARRWLRTEWQGGLNHN